MQVWWPLKIEKHLVTFSHANKRERERERILKACSCFVLNFFRKSLTGELERTKTSPANSKLHRTLATVFAKEEKRHLVFPLMLPLFTPLSPSHISKNLDVWEFTHLLLIFASVMSGPPIPVFSKYLPFSYFLQVSVFTFKSYFDKR